MKNIHAKLIDLRTVFFRRLYDPNAFDASYSAKAAVFSSQREYFDDISRIFPFLFHRCTILDIGANDGSTISFFYSLLNADVYGVDVNPDVIPIFGMEDKIKLYDGVHLPYDDKKFDFVTMFHVLGHVEYPDKLLEEVARVLKPTGSVIFINPNPWYTIGMALPNLVNDYMPDLTIIRYFFPVHLAFRLAKAGFNWPKIILVGKSPRLLPFKFAKQRYIAFANLYKEPDDENLDKT